MYRSFIKKNTTSVAILILSDNPHGFEEIQHLLSGQILFINISDVLSHAPIYILILLIWFLLPNIKKTLGFYVIFAIAITSSVQLVGVYVVFISLIIPALCVNNLKNNQYKIAWTCGILSIILGILSSIFFDLPTGPLIVISYIIVAIVISARRFFISKPQQI